MIAVTHDQERFSREFPRQPRQQRSVVLRRHPLASDILLYVRRIAEVMPVWREFGTQAGVPGEMIGDGVNVEKERPVAALALDDLDSLIEIETVGLEVRGAEVAMSR